MAEAGARTVFVLRTGDLIWSGARLLLEAMADVAIAGEATDVEAAEAALGTLAEPPDVVITAPRLPGVPVQELLPRLRDACPRACVLVLAEAVGPDDLAAVAATGIERYAGYLLWDDLSARTLRQCLGAVSGGDVLAVSRAAAERFLAGAPAAPVPGPDDRAPAAALSERERAVLECLAAGRREAETAAALGLSPRTTKRIVAQLHAALDAPTLFCLGARAAQLGLLEPVADPPARATDRATATPAATGAAR